MARMITNLIDPESKQHFASTDEALAKLGLDWNVEKRAATYDWNGNTRVVPKTYHVVRSDTGAAFPLTVVGNKMRLISNAEQFAPLNSLVEGSTLKGADFIIRGAFSLQGGRRVILHLQSPESLYIAGDEIGMYMLAIAQHDGKGKGVIVNAPLRFACLNQLKAILAKAAFLQQFYHCSTAEAQLKLATDIMLRAARERSKMRDLFNALLEASFSPRDMEKMVLSILPKPEPTEEKPVTARMIHNWEVRFETIMKDSYMAPDLNNFRPTMWGAINAVLDAEQHHFPVKGSEEKRQESLFVHSYDKTPLANKAMAYLRVRLSNN